MRRQPSALISNVRGASIDRWMTAVIVPRTCAGETPSGGDRISDDNLWPGRATDRWPEFQERTWSEFSEPAKFALILTHIGDMGRLKYKGRSQATRWRKKHQG